MLKLSPRKSRMCLRSIKVCWRSVDTSVQLELGLHGVAMNVMYLISAEKNDSLCKHVSRLAARWRSVCERPCGRHSLFANSTNCVEHRCEKVRDIFCCAATGVYCADVHEMQFG